jgi:beta-glucosidase
VNESLLHIYDSYMKEEKKKLPIAGMFDAPKMIPEMEVSPSIAAKMAGLSDYAIITIGRNSGEGYDRSSGDGDFNLTAVEKKLISTVTQAFHRAGKKCVVILNVGGVIETASWREIPDAILLAWQAGQETGNSIADVISGKVNPSGKLASTFPIRYEDVPSSDNFPGVVLAQGAEGAAENQAAATTAGPPPSSPSEIIYKEGIYVGYRYYDSFNVAPGYEFGYGLSYTKFEYSNINIGANEAQKLVLSVDVTNTGDTAGREVVQLYIGAPSQKMEKPEKELKGFVKTKLLAPGETETVTFQIPSRSLASFDTASSSWIAEAGRYRLLVGASSRDIRQETYFDMVNEITVKAESKALAPANDIDELKRNR